MNDRDFCHQNLDLETALADAADMASLTVEYIGRTLCSTISNRRSSSGGMRAALVRGAADTDAHRKSEGDLPPRVMAMCGVGAILPVQTGT